MSKELNYWLITVIPAIHCVLLIILAICAIIVGHKRRVNNDIHLVSLSSLLVWAGLIVGLFINLVIMFVHLSDDWTVGPWLGFEAFYYGCVAMMLAYLNETIKYDHEGFVTSNFLGIKRHFDYVDITGISDFKTRLGINVYLHFGGKKVRVDAMTLDANAFIVQAQKSYYQHYNKEIPKHKPKSDPMNGNLQNPWFHFMFALFGIAIGIIGLLWISHDLRPADSSIPSNSEERIVTFCDYDYDARNSGTWLLYTTTDEKAFSLAWLEGYEITPPSPVTLCKEKHFLVTVHKWKKPYINSEYEIIAISSTDGRQLISSFDRNTAYRNTQMVWGIIGAVPLIACILFSIVGILVGRNPENYSRKFRKIFYEEFQWSDPAIIYKRKKSKK